MLMHFFQNLVCKKFETFYVKKQFIKDEFASNKIICDRTNKFCRNS